MPSGASSRRSGPSRFGGGFFASARLSEVMNPGPSVGVG